MGEVYVITSGKGGVGKTTTSANIGAGLAELGRKVILIDTDIGLRNLDVVLGLENKIIYNLVDVIEGRCRIKQAIIRDLRFPNLSLLPSSQSRDKSAVTPYQMCKLIDQLREDYDYILLDCPAGIEQGFANAIAGADQAIIVTTPEVSSIRDADRVSGLLCDAGIEKINLIVNRFRYDLIKRGEMMSVDDVVDILGLSLLGYIPDDEQVVISTNHGFPIIHTKSPAGLAYANICNRIIDRDVPISRYPYSHGLISRLGRLLKIG